MEMTASEKLIVGMLADLCEHTQTPTEFNLDLIREAMGYDELWAIEHHHRGLQSEDYRLPPEAKRVFDILDVWQLVELSYEALEPKEKDRARDEFVINGHPPSFDGFDGNNEGRSYTIASMAINQMGLFGHFKGRDLNAHRTTLDPYLKMVHEYNQLTARMSLGLLDADSLIRVVNAQYE